MHKIACKLSKFDHKISEGYTFNWKNLTKFTIYKLYPLLLFII